MNHKHSVKAVRYQIFALKTGQVKKQIESFGKVTNLSFEENFNATEADVVIAQTWAQQRCRPACNQCAPEMKKFGMKPVAVL